MLCLLNSCKGFCSCSGETDLSRCVLPAPAGAIHCEHDSTNLDMFIHCAAAAAAAAGGGGGGGGNAGTRGGRSAVSLRYVTN